MAEVSTAWQRQQQALRGQVLDRGGSRIVQSFRDFRDTIRDDAREAQESAASQVDDLLQRQADIRRNLGRPPNEDV